MSATKVVQLWDGRHVLGSQRGDLLVFRFRQAPAGLATRRQLRAMDKRPGGQDITAVIEWRRGRRWAGLYRIDLAVPVGPFTPAKRRALAKANTARRTCRKCLRDVGFYLPREADQTCWQCTQAPTTSTPSTPDPAVHPAKNEPAGPGLPTHS